MFVHVLYKCLFHILNVWQAMMFCAMCLFELIKKCLILSYRIAPRPLVRTCWRQFTAQWGDWIAPFNVNSIIIMTLKLHTSLACRHCLPLLFYTTFSGLDSMCVLLCICVWYCTGVRLSADKCACLACAHACMCVYTLCIFLSVVYMLAHVSVCACLCPWWC